MVSNICRTGNPFALLDLVWLGCVAEETIAPPRLVDGTDLMRELNLTPGRIIGQLLEAIREGQATGKIGTREDALRFAQQELKDLEKS